LWKYSWVHCITTE